MNEILVTGGGEGDCLPSGAFAVAVPSQGFIRTNAGNLTFPAPGDWPRYLRLTEAGGFQICGQAQASRGTWHRWRDQWALDPRICNGQSASIFDAAGVLQIIEPGPGVTSQGYRFVADDGSLVRGDATYYDAANDLSEFTNYTIDGRVVTIGQGHTSGGAVAVYKGVRRLLEPGNCTVIRFSHAGDRCALAITQPGRQIFRWLTLAEIEAYPVDQPPVEIPPIVIPPAPKPDPTPAPAPKPDPKPTPPKPRPPAIPPNTGELPMIAYAAPILGFLAGEIVPQADGLVSVQKPNGKWLCITPQGAVDERDSPGGSWEVFRRGKSSLIAEREGRVYVLPLAE